MCIRDSPKMTTDEIGLVVRHELVHALDDCDGADWKDCRFIVCSELRAYSFSNCLDGTQWRKGRTREDCIRKGAEASSRGRTACQGVNLTKLIRDLMPTCAFCPSCGKKPVPPSRCPVDDIKNTNLPEN